MPQTRVNPKTGERWELRDGKWVSLGTSKPTTPAKPPTESPFRPPNITELMMGGPGGASLSGLGRVAGAGVKALEEGSLSSEAAGHPIRAGLKRLAADPLRQVESASRIGAGAISVPPPSTLATGLALPAIADVVRPRKKGEDQPARVERGLLGGAQLAGLASMAGGKGTGPAKYANVSAELESFRQMVEKKPTKGNMDVAHTKHAALSAAIDSMWEPLHQSLDAVPTPPTIVSKAIDKLRGIRPELDRWVDEMMPSSKSGASQRAPSWGEVKKLNEKLWALQGKDPVVSSLARIARQELSSVLEDTAKAAGLGPDYARAKALTRKMENIKFHTAYRAVKVAPATWEIGGAAAGAFMGEALGPAGMLGGMYAGHHLGRALGKRFATEPTFKVPRESIEAERALWKDLGQEPPSGLSTRRIKISPTYNDVLASTKPATKPTTQVGTTTGARSDTALFRQARQELGSKATISDIAKRAQALKDAAAKPK